MMRRVKALKSYPLRINSSVKYANRSGSLGVLPSQSSTFSTSPAPIRRFHKRLAMTSAKRARGGNAGGQSFAGVLEVRHNLFRQVATKFIEGPIRFHGGPGPKSHLNEGFASALFGVLEKTGWYAAGLGHLNRLASEHGRHLKEFSLGAQVIGSVVAAGISFRLREKPCR